MHPKYAPTFATANKIFKLNCSLSENISNFATQMCNLEQLKIDLRELAEGVTSFSRALSDDFFEALEDAEIKRGRVAVDVSVRRNSAFFDVRLHMTGSVLVPCDICLEDMEQPIEAEAQVLATLGQREGSGDEVVAVSEDEGILDLSWPVYESIALAVPTKHVHQQGQCNPDMERLLQQHSASAQAEQNEGESTVDPRWSELEKLRTIIKE